MAIVTQKKSDKYIPYYFVAFFIFLALADGVMVYIATSTQTGLVKEHAYEEGLAYNKEVVAAREAQDALGWHSTLQVQDGQFIATLTDADGAPLEAEVISVHFVRPTQDGYDFALPLSKVEKGRYAAAVEFPLKGQWDAVLTAQCQQQNYQQHQRLVIR